MGKSWRNKSDLNLLLVSLLSLFVSGDGKQFVLIHGGGHGAWCWYKLATLLESKGHNVTTLDFGASGINPKQVNQIRSISEEYEPLMAFMASLPRKKKGILVGHSLGGIAISVAMERFPQKICVASLLLMFSVTISPIRLFSQRYNTPFP